MNAGDYDILVPANGDALPVSASPAKRKRTSRAAAKLSVPPPPPPPPPPRALLFPCPIIIDTREQLPYTFTGIVSDARHRYAPMHITTVRMGLNAGDYSLGGFTSQIALERKSAADLYNTLGQGRRRFQRELHRLAAPSFCVAAVVVESELDALLTSPPPRSQMRPRAILASIIAWQQRFPNVHWWFVPGREFAERLVFRVLERFWVDQQRGQQQTKKEPL